MKLEFIKNVNEFEEHAVRLSDFNSNQATLFSGVISTLIHDPGKLMDISTLSFIDAVNCKLVLRISEEDLGISIGDNRIFYCDLTVGMYQDMIELLKPFCKKESKGYQWLYDLDTPIGFLFSAGTDLPNLD